MRREALTEGLAAIESELPVHELRVDGTAIWPVLRCWLALRLHGISAPRDGSPSLRRHAAESAKRAGEAVRNRPRLEAADVALVTAADRFQILDSGAFNTVVDPLRDAMEQRGERTVVMVDGTLGPRRPLAPVVSVSAALDAGRVAAKLSPLRKPPDGFDYVARAVQRHLKSELSFDQARGPLRRFALLRSIWRRLLGHYGVSRCIVDGWYGSAGQPAVAAAHDLGIEAIDIQHGVQGEGHFAYSGWAGASRTAAYPSIPDGFWVWGDWDRDALLTPGSLGERRPVTVTGHGWIDLWTRGDTRLASEMARADRFLGDSHTILVTLQERVDFDRVLLPALRDSPSHWTWLVRQHRRMTEDPLELETKLSALSSARVSVVQATKLALFSLMRRAAWHVTGYSTCALEALPFGVPTLLWHESGARAFSTFIEGGAMVAAEQIDLELLSERSERRRRACKDAAPRVFAPFALPTNCIPLSKGLSGARSI